MVSWLVLLGLGFLTVGLTIGAPHPEIENSMNASSIAGFLPPGYEIIGYRTVQRVQAEKYNQAGTITDDPNLMGVQIGPGTYTSPYLGDWPGNVDSWYCVIACKSEPLNALGKFWIPERFGNDNLWWSTGQQIPNYIKAFKKSGNAWDPLKALRMSLISTPGIPTQLQMVIPSKTLNVNGGKLDIKAACVARNSIRGDLPGEWRPVNYQKWQNTAGAIQGKPPGPGLQIQTPSQLEL